jgi:hypothetical protein
MKLLKTTLLFGGLLALAMSLSAETALINVNVPFAFVAGGKTMPAGQYTIGEPSSGGILLIRGNQPNATALVLAVNAGPSSNNHAGVTFSRRGSRGRQLLAGGSGTKDRCRSECGPAAQVSFVRRGPGYSRIASFISEPTRRP